MSNINYFEVDKLETNPYFREEELKKHINRLAKHFKGNYYLIIGIATHTETEEKMVIYKALYGECKMYTRPMKMFLEKCTKEQRELYGQEYRFEFVNLRGVTKYDKE